MNNLEIRKLNLSAKIAKSHFLKDLVISPNKNLVLFIFVLENVGKNPVANGTLKFKKFAKFAENDSKTKNLEKIQPNIALWFANKLLFIRLKVLEKKILIIEKVAVIIESVLLIFFLTIVIYAKTMKENCMYIILMKAMKTTK